MDMHCMALETSHMGYVLVLRTMTSGMLPAEEILGVWQKRPHSRWKLTCSPIVIWGIQLLFVALKLTNTFPRVNSVIEGPHRVIV